MSSEPVGLQQSIRFGEDFELDLRPRRLRRGSRVLKLERIPLEILVLLLEYQGEVVSRDEIVARVWGNGVFLDTDNSIRGAIRKIRQVLKDDAEAPRFIQTVTGRGYRFIAPVSADQVDSAESPKPEPSIAAPQVRISEPDGRLPGFKIDVVDQEQERSAASVTMDRSCSRRSEAACATFHWAGFSGSCVHSVAARILGLANSPRASGFPAQDSSSCPAI